jgi:hypothetical protein
MKVTKCKWWFHLDHVGGKIELIDLKNHFDQGWIFNEWPNQNMRKTINIWHFILIKFSLFVDNFII